MKPQRINLERAKGWNLQEFSQFLNGLDAKKVDRSTKWGNPFKVGCNPSQFSTALPTECHSVAEAVVHYRYFAASFIEITHGGWIAPLRGKNLACWCKSGDPCHADVLLELANG